MTSNTQCPECYTIFVITDEQLIRSKGKVRCGRCRTTFDARLMSIDTEGNTDSADPKNEGKLQSDHALASSASSHDEAREQIVSNQEKPEPNEGQSLMQIRDRLFSEAAAVIDQSPSFDYDHYAGKDSNEEQTTKQFETPETNFSTSGLQYNSKVEDENLDTNREEISPLVENFVAEELASRLDAPTDSSNIKANTFEPDHIKSSQMRELETDGQLDFRNESSSNLEKEEAGVVTPDFDRSLADAIAVIDDTPNFNISDYRESISSSAGQEQNEEDQILESWFDGPKNNANNLIDEPSDEPGKKVTFNIEDYSQSAFDDEADTVVDEQVQDKNSYPPQSTGQSNLIDHTEDPALAEAIAVIEQSPKYSPDNYARDNAEQFKTQLREVEQLKRDDKDKNQDEDQILISEVDQLIEQKLVADESSIDETDSFEFTKSRRSSALTRWVYGPFLLLLSVLLIGLLAYQLWWNQSTELLENPKLTAALLPIKQQLIDKGVDLPVRRNLNKMELLSARVEAHPSRASTILLRASLVNRATISQPFPWLELSLTDEDGRLVSRRSLSPKDYIHNNRLTNVINRNELRQVTIELLAFPKQAHGFELRLLNK